MNCPECGKESTLEDKVMSIDYYICEFCGHYFGYLNCGQATEKQVDSMRSNYQRQIEHHIKDSGRAKVIIKKRRLKMFDPKKRTSPGILRARG